ncbi:MAG: hypothetical protein IJY28_09970 [Clostridia bacterium]|nr:hypothetical protein [Clostridia bacterium]
MKYTPKRKYIRIAAGVLVLALIAGIAVLLCRDNRKYSNFRTVQFEPMDMAILGVYPTKDNGLNGHAMWIGEGYTCTTEQNGSTGERVSVPYVAWSFSNIRGYGTWYISFSVAERVVSGEVRTDGPSPWKYSNIEITLVAGKQTDLHEIHPVGRIFNGHHAVEYYEEVPLEFSATGGLCYSEKELEEELSDEQERVLRMNTTAFMVDQMFAVRIRLPENRSWKSAGYYLSGNDPDWVTHFALDCEPRFYNRFGESETEFAQTAYFKVTYDVENTVTGERTTHSTGWISRDYMARIG